MTRLKKFLPLIMTLIALAITCSASFASSAKVDSNYYYHDSRFDNCMIIDGIDVSEHQGQIDWAKVKRQGIDFAFIRLGYSYLSSPFRMNQDSYFEYNYREARKEGVMVGVYYYSTATTLKEAKAEANYVLDVLGDRELDLPLVFDYEFAGRVKDAYYDWPSNERRSKLTSNALAFLNVINTESDYEPMMYSYRAMMDKTFSSNYRFLTDLIDSKYKVWIAQYFTDISYARPYEFWQYTSSGSVTGINGRVDCNFWYFDKDNQEIPEGKTDITNASATLGKTNFEYTKFKKYPTPTVKYGGVTLKKGTDYNVNYFKNVYAGTAYAVITGKGNYAGRLLCPFTITTTDLHAGGEIYDIADQVYDGHEQKPSLRVRYKGTTLKKDHDYTVSYSDNVDAGTAKVTVKGIRNFHGQMTKTFRIQRAAPKFSGYSLYKRQVNAPSFKINTKVNSGGRLTYKSDDTSIATVDSSGRVTLRGKTGTVGIKVTAAKTDNYNGGEKIVKIQVRPVDRTTAVLKTDHTSYDKFTDSEDFNLEITTNSDGYVSYTSSDRKTAEVDENGNVTIGGKEGKAVITVKADETEKYTAASLLITINVKKAEPQEPDYTNLINGVLGTEIKASSEIGDGYIRVNWKKSPGYKMDYYEVFRSTERDTGYGEEPYFTTKDGSKTTYKNTKGLKKGNRYYYRVRGVRNLGGELYYTPLSNRAYRTYR